MNVTLELYGFECLSQRLNNVNLLPEVLEGKV
jgi:hypothetical protein